MTTALLMGVVALPVLAKHLILRHESSAPVALTLPADAAGWQRQNEPLTAWRPAFENPSAEAVAAYGREGALVGVYVGYYRNQNYARKLVSSSNVLVTSEDKGWAQVRSGVATIDVAGRSVPVRDAELRSLPGAAGSGEERLIVWRWYWIGGRLTSSDREAKLLTAWSRLKGAGDDSAVVMLYARKDETQSGERALGRFSAQSGAAIEAALRQSQEAR